MQQPLAHSSRLSVHLVAFLLPVFTWARGLPPVTLVVELRRLFTAELPKTLELITSRGHEETLPVEAKHEALLLCKQLHCWRQLQLARDVQHLNIILGLWNNPYA